MGGGKPGKRQCNVWLDDLTYEVVHATARRAGKPVAVWVREAITAALDARSASPVASPAPARPSRPPAAPVHPRPSSAPPRPVHERTVFDGSAIASARDDRPAPVSDRRGIEAMIREAVANTPGARPIRR